MAQYFFKQYCIPPGGHFWGYRPGTLPSLFSYCNSLEWKIYLSDLQMSASGKIGHQDSSPLNGHQVHAPYTCTGKWYGGPFQSVFISKQNIDRLETR